MAQPTPLTLRRVALLFATVTLLVASPVFAGRAQILVRAEFASHSFNDKVNGQKKIWEQDFATRLADRIKPLIGFADWTAEADPAKPIAGSLVVRLTEEGGGDLPSVIVQWFYQQGNAAPELLAWPTLTVYERNDPNIASNVQKLQQHTADALAKVTGASLKANLLADFTPRVPLARKITARATEKVFELPMRSDELPIGAESVMDVEFRKQGPDASEGTIKLTRFGQTATGNIRGGVDSATLNSQKLSATDIWNANFESTIQGSTIVCYLTDYKPARTVGAIATEAE